MPEPINKIILINAATVKISGGLIHTISMIRLLLDANLKLVVICPEIKKYKKFESEAILLYTPTWMEKKRYRWVLDFFWLPRKIKAFNPDLVLTLCNIPAITKYKQVFYHDNPFVTQAFPKEIKISPIKKYINNKRVKISLKRLKYVKEVWVQTNLEKKLFIQRSACTQPVRVIQPLLPYHLTSNKRDFALPPKSEGSIRLICLNNYFEHKNIESLLSVLKLAIDKKIKLQIVFTLNPKYGKSCSRLIAELEKLPADYVINFQGINTQFISSIIKQSDGIINSSLMETFGLNCIEAWHEQRPYFISDRPFAKEVCGEAAIYFDPLDPNDILEKIMKSFHDKDIIEGAINAGNNKLIGWKSNETLIDRISQWIN